MTTMTAVAATLDHAAIEALVPHRGAMCLIDRLTAWSDVHIECTAINHRHASHPLRTSSGLMASATIEYAAQAAALHGALAARASGGEAPAGMLASARGVHLHAWRLDDLAPAVPDELQIVARRVAGDAGRLLYAFSVSHGGLPVATGRLAVLLDATRTAP